MLAGYRRQRSQDSVEYGLIVATLAILTLVGVRAFGGLIEVWFAGIIRLVVTR